MADAAAQIPEPFNVHAWLVKPSGFGAGVTFTQDRKLLVLEAEWEWLAKGGSGPAMVKVEGDLGDPDTYVTNGWEIVLDIRLQPEVNYTRWYRGRIVDVKAAVVSSKTVTTIRVQGQWAAEATNVKIDNDYTAGTQDVKTIIGDIIDAQGVDAQTRIVYDASLIAASTYTPTTFDAVGSASRVIAALAETQGSREFDIAPDTRKFRMAAEVTTVAERNIYIVGKDVKELDSGDAHDRGTNTIVVTGRNDGGQARTSEVGDAADQASYGKKMRHVILPYMSAAADLTRWANNQITDLKGRQEYSIFEIADVQSRVEGTAPPIGNIKIWRRKSDGTSDAVSLPLHKVRYSYGVACDADYDQPDCTPGEIRPRGRTIKALVFIGTPPPNLPEWNEKIELEKERISIWIQQGQNPDKYAGVPTNNLPEGRQWTEKLVADSTNKDLYLCTNTTGPTFVRIGGQNLAFRDEANAFTQENSFGSQKLTSVADPTSAQDAATKAYVDAVAIGIDWKPSVRVATTANITLSGTQTIDGVAVIAGDRVLVKNQTAGAENGIYTVAAGAWTRATDADTSAEVTAGSATFVSEGTTTGNRAWVLTTDDPITLGTTALVFTQFLGPGANDHGDLTGLGDAADHTWAALVDGTRAITGTQVFNEDIKLKPTKRIYFDDTDLTSFMAEASDGVVRISTVSTAVADFDSTGLQLQQNLKLLSGTSFALTLDHAISANRTVTYPDATGTLPLLNLAQTFTAKQDIIPASGTALQVGTTNTSGDMVFGELTGATGYNAFGLQGSLTFGTGAVAQANFYSSTADAILYINNRLNSNISLRIDNVDAFIVKGTNRDTQASANFGVGDYPSGSVSMTISKGAPIFEIRETGALADERNWWFEALSGTLKLRAANDLRTVTSDVMLIDRTTTTVDSIQLITGAVAKALMDSNGLSAAAGFRLRNSGATNYHTLTQAGSTASRTITLPDETMTLAGRDVANTFTAAQTISLSVPLLTFVSPLTTAKTRIGKGVDGERMDLSTNLSLSAGVWNLDDTAIDGTSYLQGGGFHYFRRASAGVNPRTLSNYLIIQADGDLTVADDTIKIGDQLGTLYQLGTAITLTGAQINKAAIKDEANTFTAAQTFSATPLFTSGTITIQGSEAPLINFNATTGNDYQISGGGSLFVYNLTTAKKLQQWNDNGSVSIGDVGGITELLVTPGAGVSCVGNLDVGDVLDVTNSISAGTNITATADMNAGGGFRKAITFSASIAALTSAVYLKSGDNALSITQHVSDRAGSVVGLTAAIVPALPVGEAITLQLRINGTASGTLVCTGNGSVTNFGATYAKDTAGKTFSATIGLEVEVSANTANQTQRIVADMWIES